MVCVVRTYLVIAVDICIYMGKNNIRNVHLRVVAPTFQQILFRHNDVIVHGEDEGKCTRGSVAIICIIFRVIHLCCALLTVSS